MLDIRSPGETRQAPCGVEERRSVMLVGIVFVTAVFPQLSEFDPVNRFVVVHRPLRQSGPAQHESGAEDKQQQQGEPLIHPGLSPWSPGSNAHTAISCQRELASN